MQQQQYSPAAASACAPASSYSQRNDVDDGMMSSMPPSSRSNSSTTDQFVSSNNSRADQTLRRLFEPAIVSGLANIGNTCFANSALQTIANIPAVVCALRFVCRFGAPQPEQSGIEAPRRPVPARFPGGSEDKIVAAAVRSLHAMEVEDAGAGRFVHAPRELIKAVGTAKEDFSDFGSQQDAAEWLVTVLDACSEYSLDRSITARDLADAYAALQGVPDGAETASGASCTAGVAWTSHTRHAVWRAMARIDEENARSEYAGAKAKRSEALAAGADVPASIAAAAAMPFDLWRKNKYYSPAVTMRAAGDGVFGLQLTEVKCHECGHVSRSVTEFSSLELSYPTAAERAAYRATVQNKKADAAKQQKAANGVATPAAGAAAAAASGKGTTASSDTASVNESGSSSSAVTCGPDNTSHIIWKILFLPCALLAVCFRAIAGACSALFGSEPEEPFTLDELLWQYTRGHQLRGANMYQCSGCRKRVPAVVAIRFLDLPQTLMIRVKRFETSPFGGLWMQKITHHVEFPGGFTPANLSASSTSDAAAAENAASTAAASPALYIERINAHLEAHRRIVADVGSPLSPVKPGKGTVLDLSPFAASPHDLLPPEARDETAGKQRTTAVNRWVVPQLATYCLAAVINHHGSSISSGHYTAFARKPADSGTPKPYWGAFNDHRATVAAESDVLGSQAFVLTYHKQPLVEETAELQAARRLAREYLVGWRRVQHDDSGAAAIPRLWLLRVACFAEPGPLLHRAQSVGRRAEEAELASGLLVLVARPDLATLVDIFGELRLPRKE